MAAAGGGAYAREAPGTAEYGDYSELSGVVKDIVKKSSYWERFGYDQCVVACGLLILLPVGLICLRFNGLLFVFGLGLLGSVHVMVITKAAHAASHHAFCASKKLNDLFGIFFSEVCGAFTYFGAREAHVKVHHPHTNIIGLGDSSIWKAPSLGRSVYLFAAPFVIPFVAPFYSVPFIWGRWNLVLMNIVLMLMGFIGHFTCFRIISRLSVLWSLACLFITRSMFYCPYIHVNIFQHIGLSMYHPERRPKRLRLMATGVLNLERNLFLDLFFGHSLINCHVEHHLFPQLSDNMCMKIKPTVCEYLQSKRLPYLEDSYWNRLKIFFARYTELMVDAPPITDFIGIQ